MLAVKPIKLIISGIGPYANEMPEINFEKFEEHGLFLITGDTGAGKTTIFDAICYALYGETSGSYRDTRNLRSEYAQAQVTSYVDFYFSHHGKNYHVYRAPSYNRPKQRGEGFITTKEEAIFYCENETPIEGINKVNIAVQELLNINVKQFKQIAMIAQGEFRELLNAKTEVRTDILRTIFMTDGYKNIGDKLKQRKDGAASRKNDLERSVVQFFQGVASSSDGDHNEQLIQLQNNAQETGSAWNLQDMVAIIDNIIVEDTKFLEAAQKEFTTENERLESKKTIMATAETNNNFITRYQGLIQEKEELDKGKSDIEKLEILIEKQKAATRTVKPVYELWQAKQKEINGKELEVEAKSKEATQAKENHTKASEAYTEVLKNKAKGEELKAKAANIKADFELYTKRDGVLAKLKTLNKQADKLKEESEKIGISEKTLKDKIATLESSIELLKNKPNELGELKVEKGKVDAVKKSIGTVVAKEIPKFVKDKKTVATLQKAFQAKQDEHIKQADLLKQAEIVYDNCQAGILASKLNEGEKCPVCGSRHHPEPARLPDEFISEDELKELRMIEESARQEKDDARNDAGTANGAFATFAATLKDNIQMILSNELINAQIDNPDDLEALFEQVKFAQKQIQELEAAIEKQEKVLTTASEKFEQDSEALREARNGETKTLEKQKEDYSLRKSENERQIATNKGTLTSFAKLEYDNLEAAEKHQNEIAKGAIDILDAIEKADKARQAASTKLTEEESALRVLKENLTGLKSDEAKQKEDYEKTLADARFESEAEFLQFKVEESAIEANEAKKYKYDQDVKTNASNLIQAQKDAEGKIPINIEELEEKVKAQEELVNAIRSRKTAIEQRITGNTQIRTNISGEQSTYERLKNETDLSTRLYNLTTGQIKGKTKITLEQYIQAAGFDSIIAAANKRLLPMSDGQYELYRQEDPASKQSNKILDLEVLDNFTGHRRPVGNLSGGESFKASLSLALGLSDTVSSNFGGIQIDALFVDEGFGTLDRKSIESAMEILVNLSGANKLVGIISHREELKENIPQQIKVEKTKTGSKITIDTGY